MGLSQHRTQVSSAGSCRPRQGRPARLWGFTRLGWLGLLLVTAWLPAAAVQGGGHYEVNWLPAGFVQAPKEPHEHHLLLPADANGPWPVGIVLLGSRPKAQVDQPPVVGSDQPVQVEKQIPATVKIRLGSKSLPDWELEDFNTPYVINFGDIRDNPGFAHGELDLHTEIISDVEGIALPMMFMPDVLVLGEHASGPLLNLIRDAADPTAKAFMQGLFFDLGGDKVNARKSYEALTGAADARIARMARRGLRKLAYDQRPHNPSGNLNERYRWGLYLQQCGLYSQAFLEFDAARLIAPGHAESLYRAGEMAELISAGVIRSFDYIQRAGFAATNRQQAIWRTLVITDRTPDVASLTNLEVRAIKEHWLLAAATVWGASGGQLNVTTTFFDLQDAEAFRLVSYGDGLMAPAEDIIYRRGWFDSVIYVRPRADGEEHDPVVTIGPDRGPKGAALSRAYPDSNWADYLHAWFEHYTMAAKRGEVLEALPDVQGLAACGPPMSRYAAAAVRSVLRYHLAGDECKRPRLADDPVPGSYVDLWQIEGPFPVRDVPPQAGTPARHVLDALEPGPATRTTRIASERDFVNLAYLMPDAGWALGRATTWVYSPVDQTVRMWIGQNDGAAVWLNGKCIHRGEHYSANKFEDRNLVDTVASYAPLRAGWNELVVVVESWPAPRDKGWGFSIRFCTWDNEPVPGLAYLNTAPGSGAAAPHSPLAAGPYHDWASVSDDWRNRLPALGAVDLERLTGLAGLQLGGRQDEHGGYFAVTIKGRGASPGYRPIDATWDTSKDRDVTLNNVMDAMREDCCALAYQRDGVDRALMFLKPEALEGYLRLLKESPEGRKSFGDNAASQRMLGFVLAPAGDGSRALFVLDVAIGKPQDWPTDEEDLLEPISPVFVPNPPKPVPAKVGPPSKLAPSASPPA